MPGAPPPNQAEICYGLQTEYLAFGCPTISSHPTYQHPGCVAIRSRQRRARCAVPGDVHRGRRRLDGVGLGTAPQARKSLQAVTAFRSWLGKYPDSTAVALDETKPDSYSASTRGNRPGIVFVSQKLADLMEINHSMINSPDPTVWFGNVGQLRPQYEYVLTREEIKADGVTMLKRMLTPSPWTIGAVVAVVAVIAVAAARERR